VPQVTAWIFVLGLWLMGLAIVAALAHSLPADFVLLGLGLLATALVFRGLTRGR
jgi:hypothetical protein